MPLLDHQCSPFEQEGIVRKSYVKYVEGEIKPQAW
jgi:hypothetical protein